MRQLFSRKNTTAFLAVMMLLTAIKFAAGFSVSAAFVIPNYAGSTKDQASGNLYENGMTPVVVYEYTQDVNFNELVLRTDPPAGSSIEAGATVTLVIGTIDPQKAQQPVQPEQHTLTIPNVIRMTKEAVQQSLTENGFPNISYAEEDTEDQEMNGHVLRTEPAIGTAGLAPGTPVTVFLGRYTEKKIPVPDVTGKDTAEAEQLLKDAGFTVNVVESSTSDEDEDGKVYRQDPEAGSELNKDAVVVLHVYKVEEEPESESESESQDEDVIDVGGCLVYKKLTGVAAPAGFTAANDMSTFDSTVEAFYSTVYSTYVYYAEKDGTGAYYLYDPLHESMLPYIPLSDATGTTYVASVPKDLNEISGIIRKDTEVNLGTLTNPMNVPAWTVSCEDGTEVPLLYLLKSNGSSGFYVFENENGITLTPWDEFSRDHLAETSEAASSDSGTEEAEDPFDAADNKDRSFFEKNLIWIVIVAAIIALLIVAIIVVYKMSRRQEAMEERAEKEERAVLQDHSRQYKKKYESSYTNDSAGEEEPFDISFENAFPDELGLNNQKRRQKQEPERFMDQDGMLIESAFEDLDRKPVQRKEQNNVPAAGDAETHSPSDFGTGRPRVKKTAEVQQEPMVDEDNEPVPETIYKKKGKSGSEYQELLEDNFEVVDFRKKK